MASNPTTRARKRRAIDRASERRFAIIYRNALSFLSMAVGTCWGGGSPHKRPDLKGFFGSVIIISFLLLHYALKGALYRPGNFDQSPIQVWMGGGRTSLWRLSPPPAGADREGLAGPKRVQRCSTPSPCCPPQFWSRTARRSGRKCLKGKNSCSEPRGAVGRKA